MHRIQSVWISKSGKRRWGRERGRGLGAGGRGGVGKGRSVAGWIYIKVNGAERKCHTASAAHVSSEIAADIISSVKEGKLQ